MLIFCLPAVSYERKRARHSRTIAKLTILKKVQKDMQGIHEENAKGMKLAELAIQKYAKFADAIAKFMGSIERSANDSNTQGSTGRKDMFIIGFNLAKYIDRLNQCAENIQKRGDHC